MTGDVTRVVTGRSQLHAAVEGRDGVALVPTMGALHAGHSQLIREARRRVGVDGLVVVSVFINPTQFSDAADLAHYPRSLESDVEVCAREGTDIVFAPGVPVMYPRGEPSISVDPGPLGTLFEGAVRPGHFRGVLTVVSKLLRLTSAVVAVFGEKDYQQLVLVRRMVADLDLGVQIVGVPTVRDPHGLPWSSRNFRLSDEDRAHANLLADAVADAAARAPVGAAQDIVAHVHGALDPVDDIKVDYVVVTDPELGPPPLAGIGRLLAAARIGPVRILDNAAVSIDSGASHAAGGAVGTR